MSDERLMKKKRTSMLVKRHERNSWSGTKLGLITAGEDAQGLNAALRSAVRMGLYLGCEVTYIKQGFKGLVEGLAENFVNATWDSTSDSLGRAGTFIKSFKCEEFKQRPGRLMAAKHLIEHDIQHIIVIGGEGTMRGCYQLQTEWISLLRELDDKNILDRDIIREHRHLRIMCIPCSITNDLCGTDMCIGVDSALHRIIEATDNIATTSSSTKMAFVVEVMGGNSGYLALDAGLICDASMVFIPEYPPQGDWREELYMKVRDDLNAGSEAIICIIAAGATDKEGLPITPEQIKDVLVSKLGIHTGITVLGHFQNGGVPSAYDRLLATRMGAEAVGALRDQHPEEGPSMVSICENDILVIPVISCLEATDQCHQCIKNKEFAEAVVLKGWHFQHILNSYNLLHSMRSSAILDMTSLSGTRKIGILQVGKSGLAQAWVVKAIVGYCQSKYFCPLVIKDGFDGLVKETYTSMVWNHVKEMTSKGTACLGSSHLRASNVGLAKVAAAIGQMDLSGLIILGDFEAYRSLVDMDESKNKYSEFDIPMCMLPITVHNNIPGTDVTIGSDTTLNEIMSYCDKMKRAARGYQNCVFVVETTGRTCGYLATIAGLVCGADAAYIKQEKFNLEVLLQDAAHLRHKIQNRGVKLGLILRNEMANENYSTDFIHKVFSEEGQGIYMCRASTIGHLQVGGLPSAHDRSMAICNGFTVAAWMTDTIEENDAHTARRSSMHSRLGKTVLSITGSTMTFEPISKLVAESNFEECVPLFMWWMKLRPLMRVLSGAANASLEMASLAYPNADMFLGSKSDLRTPSSTFSIAMKQRTSTVFL